MFKYNFIVLLIILIVVLILLVLMPIKIVIRQKKKYNECMKLIKENENIKPDIEYGMSTDEINKIDSNVNVNDLMKDLFDTYLRFEDKFKMLDTDLKNELCGYFYEKYINMIKNYKLNYSRKVKEDISLINYSIIEFFETELKFRVTINCVNYMEKKKVRVRGSNLYPVEQIIIISYKKIDNKWLISDIEKVYEKKIGNY